MNDKNLQTLTEIVQECEELRDKLDISKQEHEKLLDKYLDLVEEIAIDNPIRFDSAIPYCKYCRAKFYNKKINHKETCTWLKCAKELGHE